MKLSKRRFVLGAVTVFGLVLMSPFLLLEGSVFYDTVHERLHRIPFDSTKWQNSELVDSTDPVRIRMVDDLVRSKRLDRRTREEVVNLLGKPPKIDYFNEYDYVYWLGPERGFVSADSEWLAISFDDRGVVRKYTVVRD